jgi:hypothetical protein
MRRKGWLVVTSLVGSLSGSLLAGGCGGRVVGLMDDAGSSAPPQRGSVDGGPPPPPPMDAPVVVVDAAPDRITVVDTGPPDLGITMPCTVANNNCPEGFYCASANCTTGVCTAAPASSDEEPVCGCDRLTYWNTSIAAANGASVRAAGACAAGTACSANNPNCPAPALCNLEQPSAAGCNLLNPGGRCWVLPDTCPPQAAGTTPTTRRCNNNNACQTRCNLITNARTFFVDPTCP